MRTLVFLLLTLAAVPRAARAADAEGCVDLKPFPKLEGCVIVECSAKHHDPFEAGDGSGAALDSNTNALSYSCPVGDLPKMQRDIDGQLRKAGYQNITPDKSDAASPGLTARKGSQWMHWTANTEDGATSYSITVATGANEKFKVEACGQPPVSSSLKQCEIVECASKSEDSVAMRTGLKGETSLTGNVQTVALACPSLNAVQAFAAVESELKASGFEILFSDHAWVTGRAGKRWVELAGALDGESGSFALTVVPSAEVLTASAPQPSPEPKPEPKPEPERKAEPAPQPVQVAAQIPLPAAPLPEPAPVSPGPQAPAEIPSPATEASKFVPPTPILEVPI